MCPSVDAQCAQLVCAVARVFYRDTDDDEQKIHDARQASQPKTGKTKECLRTGVGGGMRSKGIGGGVVVEDGEVREKRRRVVLC